MLSPTKFSTTRLLFITVAWLALLLLWDLTGFDLPLARLVGSANGFALRGNQLFELVMHEIPKILSWVFVIGLLIAIGWPLGFLRRLTRAQRVQLALTALASVLVVSLIKGLSRTSCPWDVDEFGGAVRYVSHLSWFASDGGPGHCFPAGHASAAFGYVGGWFVLRRAAPRVATGWLVCALLLGLALGLGQQWRGAHYMSHTLWTAWVCWAVGFAIDLVVTGWSRWIARWKAWKSRRLVQL